MITSEEIIAAKNKIFTRFDKAATYRPLDEGEARHIVAGVLNSLMNDSDSKEDITNEK